MKIRATTSALLVLLLVSLFACATFAYLWIDRSISLSYERQSFEADRASARKLEQLIATSWVGMPQTEVLQKLQAFAAGNPATDVIIKQEDDVIWLDATRFNFERGRLKSVGDN